MSRHQPYGWVPRGCSVVGFGLALLAATPLAWAITEGPTYGQGAMRKLGRGIANVVTCPAELIRTSEKVRLRDGYLAAVSVGIVEGAWRTLLRGVVGVFEVATFYAEVPNDFKPIILPEFVYAKWDWVQEE